MRLKAIGDVVYHLGYLGRGLFKVGHQAVEYREREVFLLALEAGVEAFFREQFAHAFGQVHRTQFLIGRLRAYHRDDQAQYRAYDKTYRAGCNQCGFGAAHYHREYGRDDYVDQHLYAFKADYLTGRNVDFAGCEHQRTVKAQRRARQVVPVAYRVGERLQLRAQLLEPFQHVRLQRGLHLGALEIFAGSALNLDGYVVYGLD